MYNQPWNAQSAMELVKKQAKKRKTNSNSIKWIA